MDKIMAVISLLFFVVLIVGLIKPSAVLGFMKTKTRWRVLLIYGVGFFPVLFLGALIQVVVNPTPPEPSPQALSSPQMSEQKEATRAQDSKGGSILYNMTHDKPPEQPSPPQYVSTDFAEYGPTFSINNNLTELQKDQIFDTKYKGRLVKWTGRVEEVDKGIFGGLHIGIKHLRSTLTYDVLLYLKPEEEAKAIQLRKGQTITYAGKLKDWGEALPHSVDEGVILEAR